MCILEFETLIYSDKLFLGFIIESITRKFVKNNGPSFFRSVWTQDYVLIAYCGQNFTVWGLGSLRYECTVVSKTTVRE